MAKPEWGTKRHCQGCNAKFYDLQRSPIVCPKCGGNISSDMASKARRPRSLTSDLELAAGSKADLRAENLLEEGLEVDLEVDVEDEALMEDTSDLGEDDDIPEVIEHPKNEEES